MSNRLVVLVLAFFSILAFNALAIREETSATGFTMYYSDTGRLLLSINPDDLNQMFGEGYWEVSNGFLSVYQENIYGEKIDFGLFAGAIIVDSSRETIEVTNGAYNSPSSNPIRVEGRDFKISFAGRILPLISIKDGVYIQGHYFVACAPQTEENKSCELGAQAGGFVNAAGIEGEGFITHADNLRLFLSEGYGALQEYIRKKKEEGEDVSAYDIYPIQNIDRITIDENPHSIFSMSILPAENARLGEWNIDAGSEEFVDIIAIEKMGNFFIIGDDVQATARNASYAPVLGMTTGKRMAHNSISIEPYGAYISLESGTIFVTNSEEDYHLCPPDSSCLLFKENALKIKPRANMNEDSYTPIWISVTLPEAITNIEIDAFDTAGTESWINHVKIRRAGVSAELAFYNGEVLVSPGGNWFDLKTDFKADIETEEAPSPEDITFTETVRSGVYDVFECTYIDRKCYLNGVQVGGFTQQAAVHTCSRDSDCDAERKCLCLDEDDRGQCVGKVCAKKAACTDTSYNPPLSDIPGISEETRRAIRSARKLDFVFISDEYDSAGEFNSDIRKAVDNGLFAVSPFMENKQKFLIYKMDGGTMPFLLTGAAHTFLYEAIAMQKQCPGAEIAVVLSKKDFNSFAMDLGSSHFVEISRKNLYDEEDGELTVAHELAHAIGNLHDEYYLYDSNDPACQSGIPNCLPYDCEGRENCVEAKTFWGLGLANKARNSGWKGCGGYCNDLGYAEYLKPAENSVMGFLSKPGHSEFSLPAKDWLNLMLAPYSIL
ncbi:MAG TPA: hypothetical protein HA362_01910 [Nanoarchaeota archaeon]|nr:hypothetical protein [Nanoarchaeota archaeon]